MKKLFLIILFLLVPYLANAQEFARMNVGIVGGGVPSVADGPNVYYYSCTETPLVEPTWDSGIDTWGNTYANCADVVITTGGSLTKISVKKSDTDSSEVKFGIYNTSGTRLDSGTCSFTSAASGWVECTKSTPYTVGDAATLRICLDANSTITIQQLISQDGYYENGTTVYANFPTASITLSTYSAHCYAVSAYVD